MVRLYHFLLLSYIVIGGLLAGLFLSGVIYLTHMTGMSSNASGLTAMAALVLCSLLMAWGGLRFEVWFNSREFGWPLRKALPMLGDGGTRRSGLFIWLLRKATVMAMLKHFDDEAWCRRHGLERGHRHMTSVLLYLYASNRLGLIQTMAMYAQLNKVLGSFPVFDALLPASYTPEQANAARRAWLVSVLHRWE